jgi:fatty acid desaturase
MTTTVTPPIDTHEESPLAHLSGEQLDELAHEFDTIRDRVADELGERDRRYIEAMIEMQRRLAVIGRVGLLLPRFRPLALGGAAALAAAKILENMEIGHNVMHGQWDWMNDPRIHSSTWDWDTASTAEAWKHSHNYVHHTFTNVRGKDKDLGYEIMRIDPHQGWNPVYLFQPVYNLILAGLFEWGVALHDLDFDAIRRGEKSMPQVKRELKGIAGKARDQFVKDYVAWPLVSAAASAALGAALEAAAPASRRGAPRPAVP